MNKAKISTEDFPIVVKPTEFRFDATSKMYPGSFPVPNEEGGVDSVPMNLIDIRYEVIVGAWKKTIVTPIYPELEILPTTEPTEEVPTVEQETEPEVAPAPVVVIEPIGYNQEQIWIDFLSPFVFDTGEQTIPMSLYLLILSYLNEPMEEKLAMINENIKTFPFSNSLEGFVLKVSQID